MDAASEGPLELRVDLLMAGFSLWCNLAWQGRETQHRKIVKCLNYRRAIMSGACSSPYRIYRKELQHYVRAVD